MDSTTKEHSETGNKKRCKISCAGPPCCGGGCGEYAIGRGATIRQRAFELKRHELDHTEADAVVTGCNNCRVNLAIGAQRSGWEMPVVSLAETVADNLAD